MRSPTRILSLIVSLLLAFFSAESPTQTSDLPTWPDVHQSQRDYQNNLTATDRHYFPSAYAAVEFPATPPVTHALYLKGQNIVVRVTFRNDLWFPLWGNLTWKNARLRVPKQHKDLGTDILPLQLTTSTMPIYLSANGGSQTFELTISGCPNYVAVGGLEVQYDLPLTDGLMLGDNGTRNGYQAFERVAFLDNSPTGLQALPWADLAENACRWCFGSSGTDEVLREMTRGMHYSNRNPEHMLSYFPGKETDECYYKGDQDELDLTWFLNDLFVYLWTPLDCREFAAILEVSLELNGIATTCDRIWAHISNRFYYWPLCHAGMDSSMIENYTDVRPSDPGGFNFHFIARRSNLVFDAAASYKYSYLGLAHHNPVWHWPVGEHWQAPVSNRFFGLCYSLTSKAVSPYEQNQGPIAVGRTTNAGPTSIK